MPEKETETEKNRQKNAVSGCDLSGERSQQGNSVLKNCCDPHVITENTGLQTLTTNGKKYCSESRRSQQNREFVDRETAAKLCGVSVQLIRRNAAEGKYSGAFKAPTNGGEGWFILLDALPPLAQAMYYQQKFTAHGLTPDLFEGGTTFTPEEREEHWKHYDRSTEKCQGRARAAFAALMRFDELLRKGTPKLKAYKIIKTEHGPARSTFNTWQTAVDGLDQSDWLPALVPDFEGRSNARRAPWPGDSWLIFLKSATVPGADLATAYKRTARDAEAKGWGKLPCLTTARQDYKQVDASVIALLREGETALKRLSPTVMRDYSTYDLHKMWTMDGRRLDLMVRDTKGEFGPKGKTFRLWIYAIEEVRSRYLVGYALGAALNADLVRDAFTTALRNTQLVRPQIVQCDNGMEAAAKEITGGAPWRLRGKVKEGEIIGLLPFLGIKVSFATPGHGQAKAIERLFGTISGMLETRPEFKGAYCGHTPEARPEEWDVKKAAAIDLVRELLKEEVHHYIRTPHRGDSMDGKSPMQVYTELMNAPGYVPKRISEIQFRRCVLSAKEITIRQDGSFTLHGARYYDEQTSRLAKGRGYYACYNRHNLAEPVFVYRGTKLVAENVKQIERTPGNCKETAVKVSKARANFTKATKAAAKAIFTMQEIETPAEIAKALALKHPDLARELVDKTPGEILPIAQVVELTQPGAETPRPRPPKDAAAEAEAKKQAEALDAIIWGKPVGRRRKG